MVRPYQVTAILFMHNHGNEREKRNEKENKCTKNEVKFSHGAHLLDISI